ncbi:hypothetical protein GCM10025734_30800 [Kitasatospora paranensis]
MGPAAATAVITHTHPQAVDGAIAVAVAAALAARGRADGGRHRDPRERREFLAEVRRLTPEGAVRRGIGEAGALLDVADPHTAARVLGNGSRVSAADTVPFALWAAARNLGDFPRAIWDTVTAGGDVDTTAAIVGGIVAARTGTAGVPGSWLAAREPLPDWAVPEPGGVADPARQPFLGSDPIRLPRPTDVPDLVWSAEDWQRIRSGRGVGRGRPTAGPPSTTGCAAPPRESSTCTTGPPGTGCWR